jgi:hypothetical protein
MKQVFPRLLRPHRPGLWSLCRLEKLAAAWRVLSECVTVTDDCIGGATGTAVTCLVLAEPTTELVDAFPASLGQVFVFSF